MPRNFGLEKVGKHVQGDSGYSRRILCIAGPGRPLTCSAPGWNELPEDLQKHILKSPVLTLHAKARLVPTCKQYKEAFLEHRNAEECWLEEMTTSLFGPQTVSIVKRMLRNGWVAFQSPREELILTLEVGQSIPEDSALLQQSMIKLPACGFPVAHPREIILRQSAGRRSFIVRTGLDRNPIFMQGRPGKWWDCYAGKWWDCYVRPCEEAEVAPCFGLAYLIFKAAFQGDATPSGDQVAMRRCQGSFKVHTIPSTNGMGVAAWNAACQFGEPAQRALSALHMWVRDFDCRDRNCELNW